MYPCFSVRPKEDLYVILKAYSIGCTTARLASDLSFLKKGVQNPFFASNLLIYIGILWTIGKWVHD